MSAAGLFNGYLKATGATLSNFSTGIVHSDASGVLSSSAINLNSSDVTGVLQPAHGGTGVANSATITLGGEVTTTGKFDFLGTHDAIFRLTANTDVTFPISGTLSTSTGTVTSVSGTANRITVATGTTTPVIDISASYVGQSTITTLGTVTTGVWQGTTIATANGGTGQSTYSDGQLLIGNTLTGSLSKNTIAAGTGITVTNGNGTITLSQTSGSNVTSITGTTNQINASSPTGAVTLSTPQDIATTSSPTFAALTLTAPLTGVNGGTGVSNSGLTINLSSGSTIKALVSDSSGNASWSSTIAGTLFEAFTNTSTTVGPSTTPGFYIRNSDATNNNWMSYAFLLTNGNIGGLVSAQITNQSTNLVDIVLFGRNNSTGTTEGFRLVGATNTVTLANPLPLASGGTNATLTASNGGIFWSNASQAQILAGTATAGKFLQSGSSAAPSWSTATFPISSGGAGTVLRSDGTNWLTSSFTIPNTFTTGDILYASATNVLTALPDVATGNALISGGVTTAPAWGKIGLTTHVSGTLGVGNGGTGTATAFTSTAVIFAGGSGIYTEDASFFAYDSGSHRLSIGTNTFLSAIALYVKGISGTVNSTLALDAPSSTAKASVQMLNAGAVKWEMGKSVNGGVDDFEIFDSVAGAVCLSATTGGNFTIGTNTSSQLTLNAVTTTTANSGATALPALAQGFIDVIINGTHRKIPYYLN